MGLAVLSALVGIAVAHSAPPTPGRLRHEIDAFVRPGWRLGGDTVEGNATCFDYCTSVTREYHAEASPEDVLEQLRPVLARHGLHPMPGLDRHQWEFVDQSGGDSRVRIGIVGQGNGDTVVSISAEASG
jgi:hypothetical protein